MHCLETIRRVNADWLRRLSPDARRDAAIRLLEKQMGAPVDRSDPLLRAQADLQLWLVA